MVSIEHESSSVGTTKSARRAATRSFRQSSPRYGGPEVQCYEVGYWSDSDMELDGGRVECKDEIERNVDLIEDELAETEEEPEDELGGTEEEEPDSVQYNVAELTEQGQRLTIAQGGYGGLGNVCNASVSRKRGLNNSSSDDDSKNTDGTSLIIGSPGSKVVLILELKSIADVGLVGMPNAGKSTLLGALSKEKPLVGDYAFTTLRPNLGKLRYDDLSATVTDIPGLIKGAQLHMQTADLGMHF